MTTARAKRTASGTLRRSFERGNLVRCLTVPTAVAGLMLGAASVTVDASELVYRPVNPNFGGNPFNSDILLGTANAQNKYEEEQDEETTEEQFVRTLQSRLLSGLASQVTDAIFGDEAQESGTFTIGDQSVSFVRGLETIQVEISNLSDGSSTFIEVPTSTSLETP
jgi:curli production assembly/transport component CsgF